MEEAGPAATSNPDRTQPIPSTRDPGGAPADERTQSIPSPAAPAPDDADKRLIHELTRRGVPPDEIQRLVAMSRGAPAPAPAKKAAPVVVSPPELPPSEAFEPKPTITLPDFREHTTEQRIEADRLLSAANVSRRRGAFQQAEEQVRQALALTPKDAAALELYGDILQAVGRVDDAVYCYGRAKEADPSRRSAEKKYAELTLLQNREIELLRMEYIPRNATVAVIFSAVLPGAGQIYNGQPAKGLILIAAALACVGLIFWSPLGFPHAAGGLPTSLVTLLIALAVIYLYAVVDANSGGGRPKSGWEV
jgi:tetratricopeptide (TPR) repeat protein